MQKKADCQAIFPIQAALIITVFFKRKEAYNNAALISSFSRNGKSLIISSGVIPDDNKSRISVTVNLIPRIIGLPLNISGLMVIRFNNSVSIISLLSI